ncbi:MAG: YeiH family protein [Bacteroidales bacterium]
MEQIVLTLKRFSKPLFILLLILCLFPFVTPPIALFSGLVFAIVIGNPYSKQSKKASKMLLQYAVVGLGFGMNLQASLAAGKDGIVFTIVSVIGVMLLGVFMTKKMKIDEKTGYLISAGTAICGGSAIAATAPVMNAKEHTISVALGTVFILNAIALFIFPPIGHWLDMTQQQFGTWAAIAIHDTSSVVGAGEVYGPEALQVATTVKLTRALWIIPMALVTSYIFKAKDQKISIPWFILFFVLAMILNTYAPLPQMLNDVIGFVSKKALTVTLFLIGSGLSLGVIREVGIKPLVLGVALWVIIGVSSLAVIMYI